MFLRCSAPTSREAVLKAGMGGHFASRIQDEQYSNIQITGPIGVARIPHKKLLRLGSFPFVEALFENGPLQFTTCCIFQFAYFN